MFGKMYKANLSECRVLCKMNFCKVVKRDPSAARGGFMGCPRVIFYDFHPKALTRLDVYYTF